MQVKCEYCGALMDSNEDICPHCGGVNDNVTRFSDGVPKTIEELRQWAKLHHLPLSEMRVHIGEDYKEPRAFGIYKDNGDYIVYKNKSDGSRSIRYEGPDEAYAVNELYMKLKEMVVDQKSHMAEKKPENHDDCGVSEDYKFGSESYNSYLVRKLTRCMFTIIVVTGFIFALFSLIGKMESAIDKDISNLSQPTEGVSYYYNLFNNSSGSSSNDSSSDDSTSYSIWDEDEDNSYDSYDDSDYDSYDSYDYDYDYDYGEDWGSSWDSDDSTYDWDYSDSWNSGYSD